MRRLVISALLVFGFPFIMTEVVDSFQTCKTFFQGSEPPVIPGVLEGSVSRDNNRYKLICQQYKNAYRFATLYDITSKIPIFSAYKYTGHYKGRPRIPWMIEPQLEIVGADMREPCVNQAYTGDYWQKTANPLDRGHLFPNCHAADKEIAESTFTLTNAVPQYHSFNNGTWLPIEQKVRNIMDSHCHDKADPAKILAYVVTGAVPSQKTLLNKKVDVPSHMWTAFCCYNKNTAKWESQAHWAENKNGPPTNITAKTLVRLQEFLKTKNPKVSNVFNSNCLTFLNVTRDQYLDTSCP